MSDVDAVAEAVTNSYFDVSTGSIVIPVTILPPPVYAGLAVTQARSERVARKKWFSSVRGIPGASGTGSTEEESLADLARTVEAWATTELAAGRKLPTLNNLKFRLG